MSELMPVGQALSELNRLDPRWSIYLDWVRSFKETARSNQIPPEDFDECGYMAGRGFGKTFVGAAWLAMEAIEDPDCLPSAVLAPTYADVKKVCFEGPAGIVSQLPPELITAYNSTDLIITLFTGAKIFGFTAEKPDRLRGPQHARIWGDELAAWGATGEDTWDMAMMGLRLGPNPKVLWTTTPRPIDLVRRLTQPQSGRVIVRGSTYENKDNLSPRFFKQIEQYEGTTIGRQELEGELIDPEESGIIRRSWFRLWPAKRNLPAFDWIIMSLDTAFTEATHDRKHNDADFTACTVWGSFRIKEERHLLVLDCWQDKLGMPDLIKRVKRELNVAYGDDEDRALIKPMFGGSKPITSGRKVDMVLIEDKGSGISLRQMLEREQITAYAYNPGRADKLSRLHMVSHIFARRRVWLVESENKPGQPRTWTDECIAQLCSFTGEGSIKHDDYVDSVTQAVRLAIDKGLVSAVKADKTAKKEADRPLIRKPTNPYAA